MEVQKDIVDDALQIIDAARKDGVTLRLLGGLAIRMHCEIVDFCERDYSDIDLVGLSGEREGITEAFRKLSYKPDEQFNALHGKKRLTFENEKRHVDVFLDRFQMEHDLDFSKRLHIEKYTLPLSDLLLTKLQIHRINEKDVKDILTIMKDCEIGDRDAPNTINLDYVAEKCSEDWGLYESILENIEKIIEHTSDYTLTEEEREKVFRRIKDLRKRLFNHPKTLAWKLRARVGKHMKWFDEVEEQ